MKKDFVRWLKVASLITIFAFLTGGCAKKAVTTDKGMEEPSSTAATMRADTGEGMGSTETLESKGWDATGASSNAKILEGRTHAPMLPVYFDFDKSSIRADQQGRIKGNADYLTSEPQTRVRIEGNCDERGTNEYNMALGERRALSAKKYLVNMGIAANRMDTISYGEERPLNYGHDELAWSQNRRDDFVITR